MVTLTSQGTNGVSESASLQFGAEVAVLKKNFEAMVENSEDFQLLVAPDVEQPDELGVTLEEFIKFVAALYANFSGSKSPLDLASVTDAISKVIDPEKFSIDLNMLFLYVLKHSVETEKPNDILEYAFKMSVHYEKIDPAIAAVFDFKSLYMAVWNTKRAKIVDKMKLKSIADMVNAFN